ncbi:MAG: LLM class flavin-dependent oxidoreductase [Flavipsychrobacter sp.]
MITKGDNKIPISILDLAVIKEGKTAGDSFHHSLDLARHAEAWGFKRYWLAEHHNMPSVASSATSVLIGYIAGGTQTLRVGSGGIMLPNHAPLVVAEQFGTLASLYPGRIDLGLGRAPGTDQLTARALRRENIHAEHNFPQDILQLEQFISAENANAQGRAIPGEGLDIPIWILGSSTDSAYLAAMMGRPYAFASHFAPAQLMTAIKIYRQQFKPSQYLDKPYVMACVNVLLADTDAEAQRLATSFYRLFLGIIRNERKPLQPPTDSMDGVWTEYEQAAAQQMLTYAFVGSPATIEKELQVFINETQIDELMITCNVYEHSARIHSYELVSKLFGTK